MTLTLPVALAIASMVITLLLHTAALFYWGGAIRQMISDHERRITLLEEKVL